MLRSLLIYAVASASLLGCTTTQPRTSATAANQPCLLQSASRIPTNCSVSPGRSYSDTDIRRTGQTDVADALQLLDPSITAHH